MIKALTWIISLLLIFSLNFREARRNKTVCETVTDYELHCPPKEHKIVVHLKAENIEVQCRDNLSEFKTLIFPETNNYDIKKIIIKFCPWPKKPFHTILNGINFTQLNYFEFSVSTNSLISLKSSYFEQLQNITNLTLSAVNLKSFDSSFLGLFPHLSTLDFNSDNIILKEKVFEKSDALTVLDLSRNGLETLPNGVFRQLNNLTNLYLWGNDLESLNKSTFIGLDKLESLELSYNKIKIIDVDAFKHLKELRDISFMKNRIQRLPQTLFKHNKKLKSVNLSNNSFLELSDKLFANLTVTKIYLDRCGLMNLPPMLFNNSTFLKVINLQSNKLQKIPVLLFSGLVNLENLYLDNNQLRNLTTEFNGLKKMKTLFLKNNLIDHLEEKVFADLHSLEKINLEGNKLTVVSPKVFANKVNLKILNLSNNSLTDSVQEIFLHIKNLTKVDLKRNCISKVELKNFYSKSDLFIKLNYNNIRTVDFNEFKTPEGSLKISLSHNNLQCDCGNYDLVNFLLQKQKIKMNIFVKNFSCARNSITCPLEPKDCPEKCACFWRKYDKAIIIDCSNQNLDEFPKFDLSGVSLPYKRVEINLKNNNLTVINSTDLGLKNEVNVNLLLSNNKIREVKNLPQKLEILELDHNELTNLQEDVFQTLRRTNITRLSLSSNPWTCDCTLNMLLNLLKNSSSIIDQNSVICHNTKKLLINLDQNSLCPQLSILEFFLILLILCLIMTICLMLCWKFQELIKIFFFNVNLCFWDREDFDDELYDAFICYCQQDEDFVNELVKVLEKPSLNYKLCLRCRDWIPGEFEMAQIIKSIQYSHRTLIVLSQNFIESECAIEEFRMAHSQLINENKLRLIIILHGEIDMKSLDQDIFMYLKTNTYLKWTDSLFWEKLKYVLPHRKRLDKKRRKRKKHIICNEDSGFLETD